MQTYEKFWAVTGILLIVLAITIMTSGCAGYKVEKDGSVKTWGVLRTLTVRKDYHPNGKLKTHVISTDSTSKDVLCGLNELADTAINTAAKIKP